MSAGAIWLLGNTLQAPPILAASPGHSQTTEHFSSWAMVMAPQSFRFFELHGPSLPIPDRSTPDGATIKNLGLLGTEKIRNCRTQTIFPGSS